MATYNLQEGLLELPDVFKDRTMNLFILSENNASEFTFVVSRAAVTKDDKTQEVAIRLIKEMDVTLKEFKLESSRVTNVDGKHAVEIFYSFKNGDAFIWQKQTIVLLDDVINGRKMVCYIGTCPDGFGDYYNKQYLTIINSVKFRNNPKDDFESSLIPLNKEGVYFALDCDNKNLFVFEALKDLYEHVDLKRALEGCYLFFDCIGSPLHIERISEEKPVRYGLWTTSPSKAQSLMTILPICRSVIGPIHLSDLKSISNFIQSSKDG